MIHVTKEEYAKIAHEIVQQAIRTDVSRMLPTTIHAESIVYSALIAILMPEP